MLKLSDTFFARFSKNAIIFTLAYHGLLCMFHVPIFHIGAVSTLVFRVLGTLIVCGIALLATILSDIMKDKASESDAIENISFWLFCAACLVVLYSILIMPAMASTHWLNLSFVTENSSSSTLISAKEIARMPLIDNDTAATLYAEEVTKHGRVTWEGTTKSEFRLIAFNNTYYRISFPVVIEKELGISQKGYVLINAFTGETQFVEVPNMTRLYKQDSTALYPVNSFENVISATPLFEIDEQGTPWYIIPNISCSQLKKNHPNINSFTLLNAITLDNYEYTWADLPYWVDSTFTITRAMNELEFALDDSLYSEFYQDPNALHEETTTSYYCNRDYFEFFYGGEPHIFTGVSLTTNPRELVGFAIINMRTGETTYRVEKGISEYFASKKVLSKFTETHYYADCTMLFDFEGTPTYYIVLKDKNMHDKKFAFVKFTDANTFVVEDSYNAAYNAYSRLIGVFTPMYELE